jgi:hypothetical protein
MKVYGIGLREKNGIVSMDCPEKLLRKLGENQFANGDRETRKQAWMESFEWPRRGA